MPRAGNSKEKREARELQRREGVSYAEAMRRVREAKSNG